MKITQAIIPAAGLGTRFLPYTKTIPKEMLPLGNKPAIQYIIEEGISAGITDFYIIINHRKDVIIDYFAPHLPIEAILKAQGHEKDLESLKKIEKKARLHYIEQQEPLGLGHAILMAQKEIGQSYFAIMLPDDIMMFAAPAMAQLIDVATRNQASVLAIEQVAADKISSYGIIDGTTINNKLYSITDLIEKPAYENAPSNLGIIGRYILSPKIFDSLRYMQSQHAPGELQLTTAIAHMLHATQEKIMAYKIDGTRFDIGNPRGWIQAINAMNKQP